MKYTLNQETNAYELKYSYNSSIKDESLHIFKSRIWANDQGAVAVYLDRNIGKMIVANYSPEEGYSPVLAYDRQFVDFDMVYWGDELNPGTDSIFIYAAVYNSDNVTQIQLDKASTANAWTFNKHTDWRVDPRMARCTALASNVSVNGGTKKVVLALNSISGYIFQLALSPDTPTKS
jgi:hypothetical protein